MSFQDLEERALPYKFCDHVVVPRVTDGGIYGEAQVVHYVWMSQLVQDFDLFDEVLDGFL